MNTLRIQDQIITLEGAKATTETVKAMREVKCHYHYQYYHYHHYYRYFHCHYSYHYHHHYHYHYHYHYQGAGAMKAMQSQMSITSVDDVMDEIQEQTDNMKQIQDALAQPIGNDSDSDCDCDCERVIMIMIMIMIY